MKHSNSKQPFKININCLQPSQLYISEDKLNAVNKWLVNNGVINYDPIPIKKLNNKLIFVDGHTRAYALFLLGVNEVLVEWEPDEWDWQAYQICVDWCVNEDIHNIKDLNNRVISSSQYQNLWLSRCKHMQEKLSAERMNSGN